MIDRVLRTEIDHTIDLFYQQNTKVANEKLTELLPKITELVENKIITGDLSIIQSMQKIIDAMEKKDNTLMADVLLYEFLLKLI